MNKIFQFLRFRELIEEYLPFSLSLRIVRSRLLILSADLVSAEDHITHFAGDSRKSLPRNYIEIYTTSQTSNKCHYSLNQGDRTKS
ncbi:hypothetical protein [Calothrix sp. NIES-2100]|uniref:hypothetical protein n=1 Tax=Calothrix sp. NIES-2100 TaxID=1954172 RepID=UPI0030DBB752